MSMEKLLSKAICRKNLLKLRKTIPAARRQFAAKKAFNQLSYLSEKENMVLSFASFGEEIDLWKLNHLLSSSKRLLLPRMEQNELFLLEVVNPEQELLLNGWGILEPDPKLCRKVHPEKVSAVLIPGLGFEPASGHRIGYGKGYYDRLLPLLSNAKKWGVGFHEQAFCGLPVAAHDIPLDEILFF